MRRPEATNPIVGTAGWGIPREVAQHFPGEGAGLERYAARFNGVEINSTFYRSHRASTYARWASLTPPGFRFALKLPRTITHLARLVDARHLIEEFRAEAVQLGSRLGPLLVQLPPSLAYDAAVAGRFFDTLREVWPGGIVFEPRHPSWFGAEAEAVLSVHRVARVAADPPPHPHASTPGGWPELRYWRLHGSPRMYYSAYGESFLGRLAATIRATGAETWCVFDNTAAGAAAADALQLSRMLRS